MLAESVSCFAQMLADIALASSFFNTYLANSIRWASYKLEKGIKIYSDIHVFFHYELASS